jgi:GR25 family glycosyltransferase involved in LPS biosynthesis
MNIVVISLERAQERRERIKDQLAKLNLDAVVMDAVDGQNLSYSEKNKFIKSPGGWRDGEQFMPGEIGCIMSTIKAVRIAREKNWDYIILMDDDIVLSEDFEKGLNFLFKIVPSDWQHIFLGGHIYMSPAPVIQPSVIPTYFKVSGSYCYILKKSAYNFFLDELCSFELPVDDVIEKICMREQRVKSYIFFPFLAYPIQEHSYIWNTNGNQIHPSFKYFKNKL